MYMISAQDPSDTMNVFIRFIPEMNLMQERGFKAKYRFFFFYGGALCGFY